MYYPLQFDDSPCEFPKELVCQVTEGGMRRATAGRQHHPGRLPERRQRQARCADRRGMCVYAYMCVYIYIYISMCRRVYACTFMNMSICASICMYVHTYNIYIYIHIYTYTCISNPMLVFLSESSVQKMGTKIFHAMEGSPQRVAKARPPRAV